MTWKWSLPERAARVFESNYQQCANFGLLLDKFVPYAEYHWKARKGGQLRPFSEWRLGYVEVEPRPNSANDRVNAKQKGDWLSHLLESTPRYDPALATAQTARWQALCDSYDGAEFLLGRTVSRLIVGLGAEHALETAITLDRNSGLPIIPGSAIKGLVRMAGLIDSAQNIFKHIENDESKIQKLQDLDNWLVKGNDNWKEFVKLAELDNIESAERQFGGMVANFREFFGWQKSAGAIIFMDGIYVGPQAPVYDVDIMNPHFGDYYIKGRAPAENLDPVPVPYLTVAAKQLFKFAVLPRLPKYKEWTAVAKNLLRTGLTQYGIGAKSSQGYGLFRSLKLPEKG